MGGILTLSLDDGYGKVGALSREVRFTDIRSVILFGGGNLLVRTAEHLLAAGITVRACTAPRHHTETLTNLGTTLKEALETRKIPCLVVDKVNESAELKGWITSDAFGLGFGPAWVFSEAIVDKFAGRFVNFMGIRMPHYLGGAHYTWQILRQTRVGAANFQLIEKTVNTGPILHSFEYLFHPGCHTPADFFARAEIEEFNGIKDFFARVLGGKSFTARALDANFAQFYPSLSTEEQGWIDWSWTAEEIVLFINAFGKPYKGASTYFQGARVLLHDALLETGEGGFHPFQRGMIYRNSGPGLWIAAKDGTVLVREIQNETGKTIAPAKFAPGERFHTPGERLERALTFSAHYGTQGLKTER